MSVFLNAPARPFSARQWQGLLDLMLAASDQAQTQVNLYLERDKRQAELNAQFMGLPGPTNVLSFPAQTGQTEPGSTQSSLGRNMPAEICISYDTLLRESRLYGQVPQLHAIFLLAHGLGHILGYEHGAEMDTICRRMTSCALESEII